MAIGNMSKFLVDLESVMKKHNASITAISPVDLIVMVQGEVFHPSTGIIGALLIDYAESKKIDPGYIRLGREVFRDPQEDTI
jgi:hypothetical protein